MSYVRRSLVTEDPRSLLYRATDEFDGGEVALRVFRDDRKAFIRHLDEVAVLISFVEDEALGAYVAHGVGPDGPFLATRWISGHTLEARMMDDPLDIDEIVVIGDRVRRALDIAHRFGLTHGDVRAKHVLLPDALATSAVLTGLGTRLILDNAQFERTLSSARDLPDADRRDGLRLLYRAVTGLDPTGPVPPEGWPGVTAGGARLPDRLAEAIDSVVRGEPGEQDDLEATHASDVTLPPATDDDPTNDRNRLPEPYRVVGEIARGGMGVILDAVDVRIRRELAVKVLLDSAAPEMLRARFFEEAQIQGQLEHPGVCPVHELGSDLDGHPFFSMKKVRGQSLKQALVLVADEGDEVLPLNRRLEIFIKVCDAMAFAHARGVIHRDLKPDNVMIGEFGEVLVMDWGLARPIDARDEGVVTARRESNVEMTIAGRVMGTLPFMPPEQARGETDLDARVDVYALGAILYSILTLKGPIDGNTFPAMLLNVIRGNITPPLERSPGRAIPPALATVAMKALASDRDHRYGSAGELRDDVQAFLDDRRLSAVDYSAFDLLKLWAARNRIFVATASAALAVLTLGLVLYVVQVTSARRDAELRLLSSMQAEATSLIVAGHPRAARLRFEEAETLAVRLDEPTVAALLGRWQLSDRSPTSLYDVESPAPVEDVAFVGRGERFLVAGPALELRETLTATVHRRIDLGAPVRRVTASRDGRWAAALTSAGEVFVVDLDRDSAPRRLDFERARDLEASGDAVVVVGDDLEFQLFDLPTAARIRALEPGGKIGQGAVIGTSESGEIVAFGDARGFTAAVGVESGDLLTWALAGLSDLSDVDVSAAHDWLVLASARDATLTLTRLESFRSAGDVIKQDRKFLRGHAAPPRSARFASTGHEVLSVDVSGIAILWNENGDVSRIFGHGVGLTAAALSRDGRFVVTGDRTGRLSLWPAKNEARQESADLVQITTHAAIWRDGQEIVVAGPQTISRIDASDLHALDTVSSPGMVLCFARSAGWAAIRAEGEVRLMEVETGSVAVRVEVGKKTISACAISDDGRLLAINVLGEDSATDLLVYDRDLHREVQHAHGPYFALRAMAFSRDGRWLAIGAAPSKDDSTKSISRYQRNIALFEVGLSEPTAILEGHEGTVCELEFAPDGQTLYSGGVDGMVGVFDVRTGILRHRITELGVAPSKLAASPDGTMVVALASDGRLFPIDVQLMRVLPAISTSPSTINVVALLFTPGGDLVTVDGIRRVRRLQLSLPTNADRARPRALRALRGDPDGEGARATLADWYALRGESEASCRLLPARPGCRGTAINDESELYRAVAIGDGAAVERLLAAGADPSAARTDGRTPLEAATRINRLDLVDLLLEAGANPNPKPHDAVGVTPLSIAAAYNHTPIMRTLLSHGARIGKTDMSAWSPLEMATTLSKDPSMKTIDLLLEAHAKKPNVAALLGTISRAASNDAPEVIARLAAFGIPLDRGASPQTPLLEAMVAGHYAAARALLAGGANANAPGTADTPLTWAAREGNESFVRLLVSHHADVDRLAPNGYTPLTAALAAHQFIVAGRLIASGASVRTPDAMIRRPDVMIAAGGRAPLLVYSGSERADLEVATRVVDAAAWANEFESVRYLLAAGLRPDEETLRAIGARARRMGHVEIADTLERLARGELQPGAQAHNSASRSAQSPAHPPRRRPRRPRRRR